MAEMHAAFYKDWHLFIKGAGLLTLFLPFLLLFVLWFGTGSQSSRSYLQPFSIAVRDEDQTVMARSLIHQVRQIEVFDNVSVVDDDVTDEELVQQGYAVVVTLPKDYFYQLYTMDQEPLRVTLNGNMKFESAAFRAVFASAMDILQTDQSVENAVYTFCYGKELTAEQLDQRNAQSANALIRDTLARKTVFDSSASAADVTGALLRRLVATAIVFLLVFQVVLSVKTIPEERQLGILRRIRASGHSVLPFYASKFLFCLLLILPSAFLLAGVLVLSENQSITSNQATGFLFLFVLLIFSTCGIAAGIAACTNCATRIVRCGSLYLLFCLFFGGSLIPAQHLPQILDGLKYLSLSHYIVLGLEALHRSSSLGFLFHLLFPLLLIGCSGFAAAALFPALLQRKILPLKRRMPQLRNTGRTGIRGHRLLRLSLMKFWHMTGKLPGIFFLLFLSFLCGCSIAGNLSTEEDAMKICICDEDQTETSKKLMQMLSDSSLHLTVTDSTTAEMLLLEGSVEGVLTIRPDYESYIAGDFNHSGLSGDQEKDAKKVLHYDSATASFSSEAVREIIAGKVTSQRIRANAPERVFGLTGMELNDTQKRNLEKEIDTAYQSYSSLYTLQTVGGSASAEPFTPDPEGYFAFILLFLLLTFSTWCQTRANRQTGKRLFSVSGGILLSFGTDLAALLLCGFLASLAVCMPLGMANYDFSSENQLFAWVLYLLTIAALCLTLGKGSTGEGQMDSLSPFLALVLCLTGGCFIDTGTMVPALQVLSYISPPGLFLRAAGGSLAAFGILAGEAALFLALSFPNRSR